MTSLEQRKQIKELSEAGKKATEIAKYLNIKLRTVRKWVSRLKKKETCTQRWVALNVAA